MGGMGALGASGWGFESLLSDHHFDGVSTSGISPGVLVLVSWVRLPPPLPFHASESSNHFEQSWPG